MDSLPHRMSSRVTLVLRAPSVLRVSLAMAWRSGGVHLWNPLNTCLCRKVVGVVAVFQLWFLGAF